MAVLVFLAGPGPTGWCQSPAADVPRNQLVVSPRGPEDGGDFGPLTAGTKTSGLQEALDAAKAQAKDVYLAGGSWTAEKTEPVVYHLHTTLRVPWMQNFRLDSGHCVLNYTPREGDAVVVDSQMSCAYRFGLIVSNSSGATVRLRPTSAGPDRFRVITSTEFVFNALVGGGGAWPGGEAYANQLDRSRTWVGTGLWLDGTEGSIDANRITVIETVGCGIGLRLTGAVTRNTIEEVNLHLCQDHLRIGDAHDEAPADNRIEAFCDSQGIDGATGATLFGRRNLLTLSCRPLGGGLDVRFAGSAADNLVIAQSPIRAADESTTHRNRVLGQLADRGAFEPAVPPSGQEIQNRDPWPVEIRIVAPGQVAGWAEQLGSEAWTAFEGPFVASQSIRLGPGDRLRLDYQEPPRWRWQPIP